MGRVRRSAIVYWRLNEMATVACSVAQRAVCMCITESTGDPANLIPMHWTIWRRFALLAIDISIRCHTHQMGSFGPSAKGVGGDDPPVAEVAAIARRANIRARLSAIAMHRAMSAQAGVPAIGHFRCPASILPHRRIGIVIVSASLRQQEHMLMR